MKTIAIIGDSHTWGEGVGAERAFVPPVCCGDLRPVPFSYPTYVNLLREAVNRETGSSCCEYQWDGGVAVEAGSPLKLEGGYTLARVFFRAEAESAEAVLTAANSDATVTVPLQSDTDTFNACIRVACIRIPDDGEADELTVVCEAGKRILVQRVELYRGEYAVINCGIGSCPAGRYVDAYFDRYITPLSPDAILYEGNTINDWLQSPDPDAYASDLCRMLEAQRALTSHILWHTVTPIGGNQINSRGIAYDAYVDAMRHVAAEQNVALVDCNAEMNIRLSAMPEEARGPYFFADPWHPNGTGHKQYADMIGPSFRALL